MDILLEWGPIVAMVFVGLYLTVARPVVARLAANPKEDRWDEILETMEKIDPYVEKIQAWADPDNPEVPTGPTEK